MHACVYSGGLRVSAVKIDPYLNIDAGTMSPFEHGEVFVLDDGGEVSGATCNHQSGFRESLYLFVSTTHGHLLPCLGCARRCASL